MTSDKTRQAKIFMFINMLTKHQYIKSTFQSLTKAKYDIKKNYNEWLQGNNVDIEKHKLFADIRRYGWNVFRMELIKTVEVNNKQELYAREGECIRERDTFVNGLNEKVESVNVSRESTHHDNAEIKPRIKINWKDKKSMREYNRKYKREYRKANKYRFQCKACDYSTSTSYNWKRHCKSKKHKRNGKLKKHSKNLTKHSKHISNI